MKTCAVAFQPCVPCAIFINRFSEKIRTRQSILRQNRTFRCRDLVSFIRTRWQRNDFILNDIYIDRNYSERFLKTRLRQSINSRIFQSFVHGVGLYGIVRDFYEGIQMIVFWAFLGGIELQCGHSPQPSVLFCALYIFALKI